MREQFSPRGIGSNWLPCCICRAGGRSKCQPDMASFVKDRAAGLRVHSMFAEAGLVGTLDYRPTEPQWVQYKLGACEEHVPFLKRLAGLVAANEGQITPELIREAVDAPPQTGTDDALEGLPDRERSELKKAMGG